MATPVKRLTPYQARKADNYDSVLFVPLKGKCNFPPHFGEAEKVFNKNRHRLKYGGYMIFDHTYSKDTKGWIIMAVAHNSKEDYDFDTFVRILKKLSSDMNRHMITSLTIDLNLWKGTLLLSEIAVIKTIAALMYNVDIIYDGDTEIPKVSRSKALEATKQDNVISLTRAKNSTSS